VDLSHHAGVIFHQLLDARAGRRGIGGHGGNSIGRDSRKNCSRLVRDQGYTRKLGRIPNGRLDFSVRGRSIDRGRVAVPAKKNSARLKAHRQGFNSCDVSHSNFQIVNAHAPRRRLIALMRQEAERRICKFLCVSSRAITSRRQLVGVETGDPPNRRSRPSPRLKAKRLSAPGRRIACVSLLFLPFGDPGCNAV